MADAAESYEYSYLRTMQVKVTQLVQKLNDLGAEGWSLVALEEVDETIGGRLATAIIRRPIEPLPEPPRRDEGWYDDPSGRFDLRFWNGRAWTFSVARKADESVHRDPPTSRTPTPGLLQ